MLDTLRQAIAGAIYSSKAVQQQQPVVWGGSQQPNIPVYVDMTVARATRQGYKISIYVYKAIRTIIQAASAVPWAVLDDNDAPMWEHPLTKVLDRPNPEFSGQDLMEFTIAHLLQVGNALWQPVIGGSQVKELWSVMPDLVRPIPGESAAEWLKGWQVTLKNGGRQIMPPETFIHFYQVDPGNPYWGTSPLMAAARTIDTDNEAQDTQKVSMQNRGVTDGVFTHEFPLNKEQFDEQRRQIREMFLAKSRRREPWVLGAGAKWNQMSLTPVEMDYIQSRLFNSRGIATAFSLDPWWVGDREHSTFNNVREAKTALYEDTVIPLLDDVKGTLNLKLSPLIGGARIGYDVSGIPALRADFTKKSEQAKTFWAMGVPFKRINDKLELGFDEFPGWDMGFVSTAVLPLGSSGQEEPEDDEGKSLDLEGTAIDAHWKAVDRRRVGWWGAFSKRLLPLYKEEGTAVLKAINGATVGTAAAAAGKAITKAAPAWEKTMTALLIAVAEDFGKLTAEQLGEKSAKWVFEELTASMVKWITGHGAESVKTILASNLADVRKVILDNQKEGMDVIGRKLRGFYEDRSAYKAQRVARTEVGTAAGYGQHSVASESRRVKGKRWISSRDDRVRDSHQGMDGQKRKLDAKYSNGCMFPGDPAGGAAEVVMCRCAEQYLTG